MGCRWLAKCAGYQALAEDAFVAGLLYGVGKLSLLCIIEDIMQSEELIISDAIVNLTLKQLYCEHGAKLLEIWNLPQVFREVVLSQQDDEYDGSNAILSIVRLVDKACAVEGVSDMPNSSTINLVALPETQALGLTEIDLAELRLVLEDFKDERQSHAAWGHRS